MFAKTLAKLMQKHSGRPLLRPVRADQSEQTGLFGRLALKGQKLETDSLVDS